MVNQDEFLYPHVPCSSRHSPDAIAFNASLQQFSQRVGYICSLQTNGKLSPQEAYAQIEFLWRDLKRRHSRSNLS